MHSTDGKQQEKRHRIRHNELIDYPVDWNECLGGPEVGTESVCVCVCVCIWSTGAGAG